MPLYEYECVTNGHRFERIQKFSDPPVDTCPTCGSEVRKLLSSPAIQFKGSGWYITDYARQGRQGETSGKGDSSAASKGEGKSEKSESSSAGSAKSESSESKPAAAPAKSE
jgi:putative FmdB family regulatory protein